MRFPFAEEQESCMDTPLSGRYFVTGTDTEIGKTWVGCRLLEQAAAAGLSCYGLKPLAAGCDETPAGWRNEDALALSAAASLDLPYEQVNPFAFKRPVAPHLAAQEEGQEITAKGLVDAIRPTLQGNPADLVLVEGAGGWMVPLNATETWQDLVRQLKLPVILVVGMKLGAINHALLTAESIRAAGLELACWVANDIGRPMPFLDDNIATLAARIDAPLLTLEPDAHA